MKSHLALRPPLRAMQMLADWLRRTKPGAMVDIHVRGGRFPEGVKCVFREDHFRFNEGIFSSAYETIYIGDAVAARVIEARQETTSSAGGSAILGGAGAGALAGVWFSPFSAGASIAVGAFIGAVAAGVAGATTTPGQITFEMRFTDDRSLVGTVDNSGWAEIQAAWRISAYAAARAGAPLKVEATAMPETSASMKLLASSDDRPHENSKGFVRWVRGFTPWRGR